MAATAGPQNGTAADSRAERQRSFALHGHGAERGGARHNADCANPSRAPRIGFAVIATRRECA